MKKSLLFITLILTFCLPFLSYAQEQESAIVSNKKGYKYGISVQPLYLFNKGLRLDFETAINNDPRKLLQISLTGYHLPNRDYIEEWTTILIDDWYGLNKVTGGGIGADYKRFLFPKANFLYISGGLTYHHFNVKYDDWELISFVEDGLTYYEPRYTAFSQKFNKLGANVCMGIQPSWTEAFLVDLYAGVGVSYGFFDEDKYYPGNTMHSVGYRGITLLLGVRFGYRFVKIFN